ncbi:Lrp/AsnC ligand binding domain-containing protein [Marinomonas sp. S3726]|uniref:Lrp/AsnC ligand binding domain-containing protein n=2 Tax=Marinomonas TaxID=28253 RepID=UPI001EE36B33|nr:Lrp/AsnC ligand binding domain-containing protein [Marinomonas sp. S3726]
MDNKLTAYEAIYNEDNTMVTGIILINVERSKTNEVAKSLAEVKGITEVFSVGGRFDLVALCRVNNNEQLADLVNVAMANDLRISKTETLISFQTFSKHDLDTMFSIGN